jgi:hypothetical protein
VRRRFVFALFPALAALALTALPSAPVAADDAPRVRKTVTVTIVFQCDGTRSVSPWQAHLDQGDDIEWVLDPSSDVEEFSIEKKRLIGGWPFRSEHPALGRRGESARGREMRENQSGKTYRYDIVAQCPGPGNSTRREVIDPDIIID